MSLSSQRRDLIVRIDAETKGLEGGAARSSAALRGMNAELRKLEKQQAKQHAAMTQVGLAATAAGAAFALGLGKAISASMDFEKSLSGLRAATGANAAGMDLLRQAALKVGKDTSLSAGQAAEAATELAKAGISTADILGGALAGAADLAAAGQLDMAKAAEITAGSMAKFNLQGKDAAHVADLLSAGSGKALGSVEDLGMALNQSGGIAAQMGFSLDETVGALAQFAEAGYTGSDAGTSFKQMMLSFVPASEKAAAAMEQYGLEFFDANGQLKDYTAVAGELQQGLGQLTDEQQAAALKTIFGADAYRVAAVAMEGGAEAAQKWVEAVDDTGHASRTAATMTDNLAGDLERLGGSFETALIGSGSSANGVLREMVQLADGALGVYTDLPGPVQATATAVAALATAGSLAAGAFFLAAPKVAAFKSGLDDMGPRSQKFGRGMMTVTSALAGPWGLALAGGVTALGLFAKAKGDAQRQVDAFTEAITRDSGAIGENARQVAVLALEQNGVLAQAEKLGLSLETVTDAALGDKAALDGLRRTAQEYVTAAEAAAVGSVKVGEGIAFTGAEAGLTAGKATNLLGEVETLTGQLEEGASASRRQAEALGGQADATGNATEKTDALTESTNAAVEALDQQAAALRAQYDPIFAMQQAVIQHAEAQDALKTAINEKGRKSKEATAAEWDLFEATVGLSGAATGLTSSVAGNTTSLEAARTQLKRWVEQGLLTQAQADTLAGKIGGLTAKADELTDTPVAPKVSAPGLAATASKVSELERKLRLIDGLSATVDVVTRYRSTGMPGTSTPRLTTVGGGTRERFAAGGAVHGYGGPTSDTVPALLSPGEMVPLAAGVQSLPRPRIRQAAGAGR